MPESFILGGWEKLGISFQADSLVGINEILYFVVLLGLISIFYVYKERRGMKENHGVLYVNFMYILSFLTVLIPVLIAIYMYFLG